MPARVPELDIGVLDQLRELDAMMPGMLTKVIDEFLTDGKRRIGRLEAAGAADLLTVRAEAHSLKGASGAVGAVEVMQLADTVEQDAKAGSWNASAAAQLRQIFDATAPHLRAAI